MADIPLNDALKQIAAAMKAKIEKYSAQYRILRERELAKAEKCLICGNTDIPGECVCLRKSESGSFTLTKSAVDSVTKADLSEGCPFCKEQPCKCKKSVEKCDTDAVKPGKTYKAEDFIDLKNSSDPKKRIKTLHQDGVLPGDKDPKVVDAPGSGGDIKKGKLSKTALGAGPPKMPSAGAGSPKVGGTPKGMTKSSTIPGKKKLEKDLTWSPKSKPSPGGTPSPWSSPPPIPAPALGVAKPQSLVGKVLEGSSTIPGKPAQGVKTMAERVAAKMPANPMGGVSNLAPAQKPAVSSPPPIPADAGFGGKKQAVAPPTAKKSESVETDLVKSLGACLFCGKSEHPGECK